jgi:hypothetical protein
MANALDHLNAGRTRIEWLAQLNTEYKPAKNYRRTSIICTIGDIPSTIKYFLTPAYTHQVPKPIPLKASTTSAKALLPQAALSGVPNFPQLASMLFV